MPLLGLGEQDIMNTMPELPEVETTCRGIAAALHGQQLQQILVYQPQLRWPVSPPLTKLKPQKIISIERRAKYILLRIETGTVLLHLGMSGSLRILESPQPLKKHDHIEFQLTQNIIMRLNDPRRFGCCLWLTGDPHEHPLLANLGVEPLSRQFTAEFLYENVRNCKQSIKTAIMQQNRVVGVGNIYATEALFMAGIHPQRAAQTLALTECYNLVKAIKLVLKRAIKLGGTTLRDFINPEGKPGYFQQTLWVYGREGQMCKACNTELKKMVIAQRSTVFCAQCQK